jgi:CheY-like chemotaxis protein
LAKVLDPASVAREGEVETIRKGSGTMAALQNSLNMAMGQGLNPDSIAQFESTLSALTKPEMERGLKIFDGISQQADRYGINPAYALSASGIDEDVLRELAAGGAGMQGGPRRIDLTTPQNGASGIIQRR